ncbi:hypothetical protein [Paenibacillus pinihumi]|uniref:hypothetical protein n=1 Tax=Paenibacillus pinihumi TaxID=669462 RepID=UPI0003F79145|nr:hypothetical protein [Paenibacillus pinihumi]
MKERFDELRDKIWTVPNDAQKLTLMEESIGLADQFLDRREAYQIRMEYIDTALDTGYPERMLVAFSWCMTEFEKNPGDYSASSILWYYKWVLDHIWRFPQIPMQTIETLFDHFKAKCLEYGYRMGSYHKYRHVYALSRGDLAAATESFEEWRKIRRDDLSDCRACDGQDIGVYHFALGEYEEGLHKVKPILSGKLSCAEVPQVTYSSVLIPLLELGREEEAELYAKKGYPMLEGQRFMDDFGRFLFYYTITDLAQAGRVLEKSVRFIEQTKTDWHRFLYLVSALAFLEQREAAGRKATLNIPEYITLEWTREETSRLAQAFDVRNQTSHCALYVEKQLVKAQRLILR